MNQQQTASLLSTLIGWILGILLSAIGILNLLVGNDPFFGLFVLLLSLLYYPPLSSLLKRTTGHTLPLVLKILLALFLLWASLGVGELFNKCNEFMDGF